MKQSKLWIGGQHVDPTGGEYFDDLNPSDQSLLAKVAKATAKDVDRAIGVAKETFKEFSQTQAKEREKILSDAASLVERDKDE
ncbi:uncharacterized protein METZ01_LOCUS336694, partial [marine metagenome]